ncbi:hypothetical protein KA005_56490, partial [bacterium]|nr:hypothetical protein [bacterium]
MKVFPLLKKSKMKGGEMFMTKFTKLLTLLIGLCFLVVPATSSAAYYEPLYADAADYIFEDDLWTGYEEMDVAGDTFSYHVWYEDGDVTVDYYCSYYDTYTVEFLTYNDTTAGEESWWYTTDYAGTYEQTYEMYYYWDDYSQLEYGYSNDGSDEYYDYYFANYDYEYYASYAILASGSYWYDYGYWSDDADWYYSVYNDLSCAEYGYDMYLYDPANDVQWGDSYWESTASGSYWS